MRMFKSAISVAMLIASSTLLSTPVLAAREPAPLITDERIKQVMYDAKQVYEVTINYGNQSTIQFSPDENVEVVALGDSIAWQVVPNGDRILIKPVEKDAAGNLSVRTNLRDYYFDLKSSDRARDKTFLIQFHYPEEMESSISSQGVYIPHKFDPLNTNLDYSVSGREKAFQLKKVFDDGKFTYFKFKEGADIPSFYQVKADGTEALVNSRREGDMMVVETVGSAFTLRNGEEHLCVKNNNSEFANSTVAVTDTRPVSQRTGRLK